MRISVVLFFTVLFLALSAQSQPGEDVLRSLAEADLKPFYHGVASGDPTASNVIIWTRVSPDEEGPVAVTWKVSSDTTFADTLAMGTFTTDAGRDYTVKVDVTGLESNTYYYYEFTALGKNSVIGRTKTAPTADEADELRFGVVSCSSYETGYFNVYRKIFERNDVDAVLHLGDYIYEYGANDLLGGPRAHIPDYEIVELGDYRTRHAQHKLDADSRKMHQNFPVIAVWDDHESANNSWRDGADNHSEGSEGTWIDRKSASLQAYYEWMPLRKPDDDFERIFRKLSYGDIADIYMLDTRLYDRDIQAGSMEEFDDEERTLIGESQMAWLQQEILNSDAKWQVIGQQVMMGQLGIPNPLNQEFIAFNPDQWDGYAAERTRLYDFILENEIENMVVLTGDIHTHWAMDLPYDVFEYNQFTGEGSVGVEFVCNAVTSTSSPVPLGPVYGIITSVLPYIKYVDLSRKGYTVLHLDDEKAQGDMYTVSRVNFPNAVEFFQQGWYTLDGTSHLVKADGESSASGELEPVAPCDPRPGTADSTVTAIFDNTLDVLSVYPNPFGSAFLMEVHLFKDSEVQVSLTDVKGAQAAAFDFGYMPRGRHILKVEAPQLAEGLYTATVRTAEGIINRNVVKTD